MDRLYRTFLILAAAVIGGLLLYAVTPNLALRFGDDAAAIWSWFLILASGYIAHRLLPKNDLSHVSRILAAVFASSIAAMLSGWIFIVFFDTPFDYGGIWQLLLVGSTALVFATFVFCPIYWLRRKIGKYQAVIYVSSGGLIPAAWIYVVQPFGTAGFEWLTYEAAVYATIGVSAAVVFMLVAGRENAGRVETT